MPARYVPSQSFMDAFAGIGEKLVDRDCRLQRLLLTGMSVTIKARPNVESDPFEVSVGGLVGHGETFAVAAAAAMTEFTRLEGQ